MTKKERAKYVNQKLKKLYPKTEVPLDHKDPYTLLVAVLLSAQCTDKRVNLVTPGLFSLADDPKNMSLIPVEKVEEIVRPCGLGKNKSKAIVGLSKKLMNDFGGEVPQNLEDLESLPGIGHKTAQVVMAQAFNIPSFPVDTHIHRLAQRWRLTNGKNVLQTEKDLKNLFPKKDWNRLHLQIIFYGREHCTARGCDGTKCMICHELFPKRKPIKTKKA